MNRPILLAISLCAALTGCQHHTPPSTAAARPPGASVPATAPARDAVAPSSQDLPGLLALLEEPPEAPNVYDWEKRIADAHYPGHSVFRLKERDRYVRDVADVVGAEQSNDGGVLLLEVFSKSGGNNGTYQRVGMAALQDPSRMRALQALGVAPVTPAQFNLVRGYAKMLLDGERQAMKPVYDMEDWLAISYFDGKRWTTRARHNLLTRLAFREPEPQKPSDLPVAARAAINLIQVANWSLPGDVEMFGPAYVGFVYQFGEHPEDGEPLPRKPER